MTVAVERNGAAARFTVTDTGIGMEPGDLDRVFTTFYQSDRSLDRTAGGLGLGLALVKGLVDLHGGTVRRTAAAPVVGANSASNWRFAPRRRRSWLSRSRQSSGSEGLIVSW